MSTDTERIEESTAASFLDRWHTWYHIPVLGVAILFMFWTRVRNYEAFITDDGSPAFAGVDSWYHWRTVQWTAEHYPQTMPYEIWTSFPTGRYVGQFGTLFDQLVVTVAMIVGLGDPSTQTLYTTSLFVVPAFAALVAVPVFFIGRRVAGTVGGLAAVVLLALMRGSFFWRTTTGQIDHHGAEVLFMAIAVLAMMVALRVGEREKPIWELIEAREWDTLKPSAIYAALAGVAITLYVWVWPSAVMLIGIFGVYFVVQLCLDYVRGVSPDHVAFVGAVSMGVATLGTLALLEEPSLSVTSLGFIQPALAFLIAAGSVFVAWLARQWEGRDLARTYFPAAVAGIIVAALAVLAVVVPDLFSTLVSNLTERILPFGPAESAASTIQEAARPENFVDHAYREFGAAFYTMLIGLILLAVRPLLGREYRAEYGLVLVWSLFLLSMGMTQIRFAYYLVLPVVVLNAAFVGDAIRLFDLDRAVESVRSIEAYQVIAVLLIVSVLFVPLLPPVQASPVWEQGNNVGQSESTQMWEESTTWMNENTPAPGNWAGADNASELEYYGAYERPADGDYDYPEGAYGVMSWWDYGHLITVQGERMPHSNPFQANARSSSAYFQAENETYGEAMLDVIADGESAADYFGEDGTDEAVLDRAEEVDSDEEMRYVMIDYAMAAGKFSAISQWTGPGYSHYVGQDTYEFAGENTSLATMNDAYHDTMLASLYLEDAQGMEHYRLVNENDDYALLTGVVRQGQQGPVGLPMNGVPLESNWSQVALMDQQFRSVRDQGTVTNFQGASIYDPYVTSTVKTYERVEGATLEGTLDQSLAENASGQAYVDLQADSGRTFRYYQDFEVDADGSYEVTVPYATNDELGVDDGYTNSSVEALDDFNVWVDTGGQGWYSGNTSVPEQAVVDGETVTVGELTEDEPEDAPGNETGDGNATDGNETDDATDGNETDDATDGNETDGGDGSADGSESGSTDGDDATDAGNESAPSLVAPKP